MFSGSSLTIVVAFFVIKRYFVQPMDKYFVCRREFGLGMFLNPSMLRAVRPKELRKMLGHFMKLNQGLIAPGQKQVTPLQAKLHYMKIVSELRSFGGKCFLATLVVSIVLWPILKYVQLNVNLISCAPAVVF